MRKLAANGLSLCLVLLSCAAPARAFADAGQPRPAPAGRFLDHAALPDAELDKQRGGFLVDGVTVSLGAQLNTYLDGQLALTTTLNVSANGAMSTTVASAALTPVQQTVLQSTIISGGTLGASVAGTQVYVANGGQTTLFQNVLNGLQNVLINTAPSVRASQTVNATIGLSGYAGFSGANLASSLGQTLGNAVGLAGIH